MGILTWVWSGFAVVVLGLLGYITQRVFIAEEMCGDDVCVRRGDRGNQKGSQQPTLKPGSESHLLT